MKTKNFMAMAIILATFGSVSANSTKSEIYGDPIKTITIKQFDNLKFKVTVSDEKSAIASLAIKDKDGNEIYTDYLHVNQLNNKLYDLSNLTDGTYTFIVKIGNKIEKNTVYISTQVNRSALVAFN